MFGPNSGAPWANLTTTFEIQAGYVVRHIKHIKKQVKRRNANYAMMVEAGVQKRYNEWIQANMGPLAITSPNCSNYYTVICLFIETNLPRVPKASQPLTGHSMGTTIDGVSEKFNLVILLRLLESKKLCNVRSLVDCKHLI